MHNSGLAALKIDRRVIAAAIFVGMHLDYTEARHLAGHPTSAHASAIGFVRWLLSAYDVEIVALEGIDEAEMLSGRRSQLRTEIIAMLREEGVPVWEVGKRELFDSFGIPPLRSRLELRNIAVSIWPALNSGYTEFPILDAAVIGLHVQVERLLAA